MPENPERKRHRSPSWEDLERLEQRLERKLERLEDRVEQLEQHPPSPTPGPAVSATLTIGGTPMPGQINVDTTDETAEVRFHDDHGDKTDAPAGAVVTFTSSDESVATVAADPANPLLAKVTPQKVGTADIGVDITGVTEPNGQPFSIASQTVTVSAGPAAGADLVLSV